ncbi:putative sulfate exporter family transporter [Streptomyces sp. NPDC096046]|uniref:putative sulfate exporter family transporter n=1 Tax=Streptomyces sp. NPDC096046 TaxID=3155542 RepID=UPI00331798EE
MKRCKKLFRDRRIVSGQEAFGLWSGIAINDTSSVVATSYSHGSGAGRYAVVVEPTRGVMIVPSCVALVPWRSFGRRDRDARQDESAA